MEDDRTQTPCPKCSGENPQDARFCCSCGCELAQADVPGPSISVEVSRMAIVAIVGALCGLTLIIPMLVATTRPKSRLPRSEWVVVAFLIGLAILGVTAILGLISIVRIERSGGRITGRAFAIGAFLIAIFSAILGVVWPVLFVPRSTAYRMVCGTNLSGIGKAMLIYSGDYDEEFPRAGGRDSVYTVSIPDWKATNRSVAHGIEADGTAGQASISSSFYLLIKYDEVKPKSFVCPQDDGTKEFVPREYGADNEELINFWDFGPNPTRHCSYSYHLPYGAYPLRTSGEPGMAVAAGRNPWIESPFAEARDFSLFVPDIAPFNGAVDYARQGNANAHARDGQNVLFLDSHVSFEKRSFCGIENDNIFTCWNQDDRIRGTEPGLRIEPADPTDSFLVNDPAIR